MKQAMQDHLDRMEVKASLIYENLCNKIGKEEANQYVLDLELEEDPKSFQYSAMGMELRVRLGKEEAYAIISLLKKTQNSRLADEKHTLEWSYIKFVKNKQTIKTVSDEVTRVDMINRLAAITYEDYGDNIEQWDKWIAFREEYGFWRTR